MRKRQKLALAVVLMAVSMAVLNGMPFEWRYLTMVIMGLLTCLLTGWALKDGLSGWEWLMIPIPPFLFFVGTGLFGMLLPDTWWVKGLMVLFLGLGEYFLLLTGNIYSVASIRTIALYRAASAVGFVMTVVTSFLLFNSILSFRLDFWLNGLLVFMVGWILLMPVIWSVKLEEKIGRYVWLDSGILSLNIGLFTMAISFWPITISVASIFLVTLIYIFLGLYQHYLADRLYRRVVWEYIPFGVVVLATMLLTAGRGI